MIFRKPQKNCEILSKCSNASPKTMAYKNLMKKYGFNDYILQFVESADGYGYLSYFIIFLKDTEDSLSKTELIEELAKIIAIQTDVSGYVWKLENKNGMLYNLTNYFPIGLMIVGQLNEILYVNEKAKEYLADMGYYDPRYYSSFYVNEICPYSQYLTWSFGASMSLKLKNYHFNIVSSSLPELSTGKINPVPLSGFTANTSDVDFDLKLMTVCIYFFRNDEEKLQFSIDIFDKLNLSKREVLIAQLLLTGASNKDISAKMNISVNTVKTHTSNIYKKAGVSSKAEFARKIADLSRDNKL